MLDDRSRELFLRLAETPSPSGHEERIQAVVREWLEPLVDEIRTDAHGNVIGTQNPEGELTVLLDGHCDQIALMVQHVDPQGCLWFQGIGGWDPLVLIGQPVTVWTEGGPLEGVIGRKAKHLQEKKDSSSSVELKDLWIDLGFSSGDEVRERVTIGDPATLRLGVRELTEDRVSGPGMDNSAGLFVVLEAARRLRDLGTEARVAIVSAVQEEIGLRGARTAAFGVDPDVGIAVDVTHATDTPTVDVRQHGEIALGGGPVVFRGANANPVLRRRLLETAEEHGIEIQHKGLPRGTANDANAVQLTRAGVAAIAVGIPNRYMHTPVEMIALGDLDRAAELIARCVAALPASTRFTP